MLMRRRPLLALRPRCRSDRHHNFAESFALMIGLPTVATAGGGCGVGDQSSKTPKPAHQNKSPGLTKANISPRPTKLAPARQGTD